ncbi:MAG: hypothetical protein P4M09_21230 [Devosia sp.]|nr:hypothetical protein [Devosia sp.]
MSKISPEIADQILDQILDGASVKDACEAVGIGPKSFSRAVARDPALARRFVFAREHAVEHLAVEAVDGASRARVSSLQLRRDWIAIAEQAVVKARELNAAQLVRLEACIADRKATEARRAARREEDALRRLDQPPKTPAEFRALGLTVDMHRLRFQGRLQSDWAVLNLPNARVLASREAIRIEPQSGLAQTFPIIWSENIPGRPTARARCACGRGALVLYPSPKGWGCRTCMTDGRDVRRYKRRDPNRVRVRAPVYANCAGCFVCARDEKGRLLPRPDRSPPAPVTTTAPPIPRNWVHVPSL